jgi:hypothetical protein
VTRVEALQAASEADEVILLELIRFLGNCGKARLFLVEGHDDVTFLQTKLLELRRDLADQVAMYNSRGKANVLKLFEMIRESKVLDFESFWFFVDRDFDELRGLVSHERIWMSPTYSFENLLVSPYILERLLLGEFRCNDAIGIEDLKGIMNRYQDFLNSYRASLRYANLCAYYAVKSGRRIHPLDEVVTPHITVDFPTVQLAMTEDELLSSLPKDGTFDRAEVAALENEFNSLDPVSRWRGKFLFRAFLCMLDKLRKDRGAAKHRHIFSTRVRMTFDPNHDPVRALSAIAPTPDCLKSMLLGLP